jgi:hypothetical protein
LNNGDLAYFVNYFLPIIFGLEKKMKTEKGQDGSEIKAKKYETLIVQLWELLPNFC